MTADNNFAERQIRPAVIIRRNSLNSRPDKGAAPKAIQMNPFQTTHLRGLPPTKDLAHALSTCVAAGQLPPLPNAAIANG